MVQDFWHWHKADGKDHIDIVQGWKASQLSFQGRRCTIQNVGIVHSHACRGPSMLSCAGHALDRAGRWVVSLVSTSQTGHQILAGNNLDPSKAQEQARPGIRMALTLPLTRMTGVFRLMLGSPCPEWPSAGRA